MGPLIMESQEIELSSGQKERMKNEKLGIRGSIETHTLASLVTLEGLVRRSKAFRESCFIRLMALV